MLRELEIKAPSYNVSKIQIDAVYFKRGNQTIVFYGPDFARYDVFENLFGS